jgi:hypothetical protein
MLIAVLLGLASGWYAYRRHAESGWPTVAARVEECGLHTWYDVRRGDTRAFHSIRCVFAYDVDGVRRHIKTNVGDEVMVTRRQLTFSTPDVTLGALQQWVGQHPAGSTLDVHFDARHADQVSLVGIADEITAKTPLAYGKSAGVFALPGVLLIGLGAWRRRAKAAAS